MSIATSAVAFAAAKLTDYRTGNGSPQRFGDGSACRLRHSSVTINRFL